jgi:hypothetical protein
MKIKNNIAISDSGFVFNPSTGESFSVNPIGIEMIGMMKEGKEYPEIAAEILLRYSTDEATFDKDFHDFIRQLQQHYLLESEENEN